MKRIVILLVAFALVVLLVIASSVLRSGPPPTEEERKQMEIMTGQLFVFEGKTNAIKRFRTIAAFDGQHEMMPYLRVVSFVIEENDWPHDRPLRVTDLGDQINIIWPLPPEIESKPIRWGADWVYATLIDKKNLKLLEYSLGN